MQKITSEIHAENDNFSRKLEDGNAISEFAFKLPSCMLKEKCDGKNIVYDVDEDLDVNREEEGRLLIEHSTSTELRLVGMQVWRGALLLADYILSNPNLFKQETILELGSGVGLTGIVASFLAKEVVCTDINLGNILELIEKNFKRNRSYVKAKYHVKELNFLDLNWSRDLERKLSEVTIILAADVIYDDEITDGFVCTLAKLLDGEVPRTVYIALEKRYVFTITDLETVAPMYEEFLRCIERKKLGWTIEYIKIDFPRYFKYERVKQMVLMRIRNNVNA